MSDVLEKKATFNQPACMIITLTLACLLLGNVSQMSNVDHGPLVFLCILFESLELGTYILFMFEANLREEAVVRSSAVVSYRGWCLRFLTDRTSNIR